MNINQFVDQLIQHDDELLASLAASNLAFDIEESRDEAIDVTKDWLSNPESGWDQRKLDRMEDGDVIAADEEAFYQTYESLLKDRLLFDIQGYDTDIEGGSDDAKITFILSTFAVGEI